ncbi:unnamed protein product [Cunninghamella blakesleeana]
MDNQETLKEYLDFAIVLAKEAGAIIKNALEERMKNGNANVLLKYDNPSDLVTETDQAVEKYIKEKLSSTYPSHKFIGEETMSSGEKFTFTNDPTWIVDPIDGTTNFVHGYPFVAVSIGLTINKIPMMGVVFNPLLNELYSAAKGLGAYLNESISLPLFAPTELTDLSQCLVSTEAGSDRSFGVIDKKIDTFYKLLKQKKNDGKDNDGCEVHSIRATGSAALNMCQVAKGSSDVYWEIGCWEWDILAALVILQEAGGIVLNGDSAKKNHRDESPVNIFCRKYLAIRPSTSRESQLKIAHQMWDIIPDDIHAPRLPVPGGYEP